MTTKLPKHAVPRYELRRVYRRTLSSFRTHVGSVWAHSGQRGSCEFLQLRWVAIRHEHPPQDVRKHTVHISFCTHRYIRVEQNVHAWGFFAKIFRVQWVVPAKGPTKELQMAKVTANIKQLSVKVADPPKRNLDQPCRVIIKYMQSAWILAFWNIHLLEVNIFPSSYEFGMMT